MKPRILRRVFVVTMIVIFVCYNFQATAQDSSSAPIKIAVLAPLYLDSAFDGTNYKLGSTSIPKYILSGLEFYNGVMMAADSLQKQGHNISLWIFDTKSKEKTCEALAAEMSDMNFSMIIAAFSGASEQKLFSEFSFKHNIPLVSATYPNDAYVSGNPYFIMINSSLKTHVEAIYKYTQRNYPIGKYVYVTRKGVLEDKVMKMFADEGKKTYALKYKTVQLADNFREGDLVPLLDSNRQNVIICGSLDEAFSANLIKLLDQTVSYQLVLIGMPTWNGIRDVYRTANDKMEIVYSTPFHYEKTNKTVESIGNAYRQKFNARPGYMFYKGFETMFNFANMLEKYKPELMQHLSDNSFEIANDFQFQPVRVNESSAVPDYIENKKLYFIHIFQGSVRAIY